MARFLIAVWPFAGHYFPLIAIADELRSRGHEVAFYTGTAAASTLEDEGFRHFPFERIDEKRIDQIMFSRSIYSDRHRPGQMQALLREWLLGTVPAQIEDLTPILEDFRPDVIITETSMMGPVLVLAETQAAPVSVFSTLAACILPGRDTPPYGLGLPRPRGFLGRMLAQGLNGLVNLLGVRFRREADALRASYDLPPLSVSVTERTGEMPLYLVPSPAEFDYGRTDLPTSVEYIGPCLWQKSGSDEEPEWMKELPAGRPLIHVSEGTMHTQRPMVLRAAAEGLGAMEADVVMTSGGNRAPEELDLGPLAENIRVERWVPHSRLLPKCDLVITTGGAGTVMAVLAAGVPLIIVPTEWDKPENAQRVVEAGAGLRLPPRRCTPEKLRAAVERVLSDPSYRAGAEKMAHSIAKHDGPATAATLLEKLSGQHPEKIATHAQFSPA